MTPKYTNKKDIEAWLKSMKIESYTIHDNLTVDVHEDVYLGASQLTHFPIQFGVIEDDFHCSENQLTSLHGAPQVVYGDFMAYQNQLKTIAYAPHLVHGSFDCSHNQLLSLKGSPKKVGQNYNCDHNQLISLEGISESIKKALTCSYNPIQINTPLEATPQMFIHCVIEKKAKIKTLAHKYQKTIQYELILEYEEFKEEMQKLKIQNEKKIIEKELKDVIFNTKTKIKI